MHKKALRCECINDIKNMDLAIGVSGIYLHLLYFYKHTDVPDRLVHLLDVTHQPFEIEQSKGHYSEVMV